MAHIKHRKLAIKKKKSKSINSGSCTFPKIKVTCMTMFFKNNCRVITIITRYNLLSELLSNLLFIE